MGGESGDCPACNTASDTAGPNLKFEAHIPQNNEALVMTRKSYPRQISSEPDLLPLEINGESERGWTWTVKMSVTEAHYYHLCR